MAKTKIIFPEYVDFLTTIAVRITDINYGNHLAHDSLISILHEARLQFFNSLGYSELNIEGVSCILSSLSARYFNQSYHGDSLVIEISIAEPEITSFVLFYRVSCNEKIIALAETTLVCFDYSKNKVMQVPVKFVQKVSKK